MTDCCCFNCSYKNEKSVGYVKFDKMDKIAVFIVFQKDKS